MNIQKPLFTPHVIMAFAMVVALTFPCIVQAASAPAKGENVSAPSPDESRIRNISAEERTSLLTLLNQWQGALEEIKLKIELQLAQHKQWQDELKEIKLQLAQLDASLLTAAASAPAPAPTPAPASAATPVSTPALAPASTPAPSVIPLAKTGAQNNRPKPSPPLKTPAVQQDNPVQQYGLFAALGLLFILALWLGQRYYTKIKSRNKNESQQDAEPILGPVDDKATQEMATSPATQSPSEAPSPKDKITSAPAFAAPSKTSSNGVITPPKASSIIAAQPPTKIEEEVDEDDLLLEEAMLYASNGRPAKAVGILLEIVKQHPSKAEAWSLLLSSYSSLAQATEFEKTAREFLKHHKDSPLWRGIQALGRTFDPSNPMYIDNNPGAASALSENMTMRRPVGDILLEMGILSKQELQKYLNDFDPKKDGRFGGYLVKRKAITLAILDQALLQQQGVGNETKPGSLPSLQEFEKFLADFDPKRDGSIGEFLASRNASTPEQLRQLIQQKSS